MSQAFLSCLICLSLAGSAAHPRQARDTAPTTGGVAGSMSGRVLTDDSSGRPVRHASVHVQKLDTGLKADVPERIAVTDDEGAFSFEGLPAGRYTVWASKNAWVSAWYGSKRPGDAVGAMSIVIAGDQAIKPLTIRIARGAVIAGTIFDQNGQPLPGARASVLQSRINFQTGQRTFVSVGAADLGVADNRGVYRIYGLAPGAYLVMVEYASQPYRLPSEAEWKWADASAEASTPAPPPPNVGRSSRFAPVYYPGTPVQASATMVTVGAGEERLAVDVRVEPVPVASIVGSVQVSGGATMRDVAVSVIRTGEDARQVGAARPDDSGNFTIANLPPGSYTVIARPIPASAARFWGSADVMLNGADQSAALALQPGLQVAGHVMFGAGAAQPPADLSRVRVTLLPVLTAGVAATTQSVAPNATGEFAFTGVVPGKYRLAASLTGAGTNAVWTPASAMVRGRDALDVPIDIAAGDPTEAMITFTDRSTSLGGTLIDASGRPAPDYFVIAFPVDQALWVPGSRRIAAVRPGVDGQYRFTLPPGAYLLGAVTDAEPFQWFDSSFLTELKAVALPITLTNGQATTQDLRIGGR